MLNYISTHITWEMKSRVFTFLLSCVILWASLAAYTHKTYASNVQQYRVSTESVAAAIGPRLSEGEQLTTDHLLPVIGTFSFAKTHALHHKILNTSPSIRKSVKAYLIFRVFRN